MIWHDFLPQYVDTNQKEDSCDVFPFLVGLEELAELSMGVSLSFWGQDVLDERCDEFESAVGEGVDWSVLGRQSCGGGLDLRTRRAVAMISNVAEAEIGLVEFDLISRSFYDPGHGTSVKLSCYPGHVLDVTL